METKPEYSDHNNISCTAYLAYWRSLSDRQYAKDIAEILGADKKARELLEDKLDTMSWFGAPMVEARGKALEREVRRIGNKDIYGIAEGALPTGLAMTADPAVTYVHSDLPGMVSSAEDVIWRIMVRDNLQRPNLHFRCVDAFKPGQLEAGAGVFGKRPFTACCKGMILQNHPGSVFVTTDINYKNNFRNVVNLFGPAYAAQLAESVARIAERTGGRNLRESFFETPDAAHRMIDQAGLEFERRPFYDGSFELTSLANIPEKMREPMKQMFADRYIYIMRPKSLQSKEPLCDGNGPATAELIEEIRNNINYKPRNHSQKQAQ
jgi:hypothetical protein